MTPIVYIYVCNHREIIINADRMYGNPATSNRKFMNRVMH